MNMNNHVAEFGLILHRNLRRKKVGLGPLRFLSFLGITMGVLILMAMAAPSARAATQLLTYYDFEGFSPTSNSPGLQTTHIANNNVTLLLQGGGSGTNVNAVTPSTNVSLIPSATDTGAPSTFTLGGLTTTGLTNVNLSFALLSGGAGSGSFTTLQLSYSTTGVNGPYTLFATDTTLQSNTTYTALSFPVSTLTGGAVDGVSGSNLFFEFAFSGGNISGTATHIDNIQVTAVPEPSSYIGSLVGILGLCWFQRRWLMTRLLSLRRA